MEIRHAVHPEQAKHFTTDELRKHFLIQEVFRMDAVKLVYSYYDRLIVGGVCPTGPLSLAVDQEVIDQPSFLREGRWGL